MTDKYSNTKLFDGLVSTFELKELDCRMVTLQYTTDLGPDDHIIEQLWAWDELRGKHYLMVEKVKKRSTP